AFIRLETVAAEKDRGIFPAPVAILTTHAMEIVVRKRGPQIGRLAMEGLLDAEHIGIERADRAHHPVDAVRPRPPVLLRRVLVADVETHERKPQRSVLRERHRLRNRRFFPAAGARQQDQRQKESEFHSGTMSVNTSMNLPSLARK